MTQDTGPSQSDSPAQPAPDPNATPTPGSQTPGYTTPAGRAPGSSSPYGSNPYSAGPPWLGTAGSWTQAPSSGRPVHSVNAISMIQLLAGVAILVSLLLPWAEVAFSWFNTGSTSASSTFVEMATSSDGLAQMWLDLVLLGVAVALFASLMSLSMRDAARSASAIALVGFGLAVLGSAYFLAEGMNWDYSILSPGNGAYLCLLAAVVGGLAAVARLANPRLGTPAAAVAGYWGGGPYRSAPPWAAPPWAAPQPWAAASPWGAPPGPTYPGAPQPPPWPGGQYPDRKSVV